MGTALEPRKASGRRETEGQRTSYWVMYIMSSIAARSLGKGNRFWTSSSSEMPVDQTSDRMVYSSPDSRSGCSADQHRAHSQAICSQRGRTAM